MTSRLKLTFTIILGAVAGCGGSGGSGQPPGPDGGGSDAGNPDAGNPRMGVVAAGVRWVGRVDTTTPTAPRFGWSGTGFIAHLSGTGLSAALSVTASNEIYNFKAVIDGAPQPAFMVPYPGGTYVLASGLVAGTHTVELYRQTEGSQGTATLTGLTVADGTLLDPPAGPSRLIEVVGDSITCGYGTLGALRRSPTRIASPPRASGTPGARSPRARWAPRSAPSAPPAVASSRTTTARPSARCRCSTR